MARTNKHALRKVTGVYTERTVTLLLKLSYISSVTVCCPVSPDGTSIRTLKTKTQFLRRPFQFSVNEVFRMKAEHFSFKMKVLAI